MLHRAGFIEAPPAVVSVRGGAFFTTNQELFMGYKLANGRELSDDEFDKRLARQHRKIKELHAQGACDQHPSDIPPRKYAEVIRGARDKAPESAQAKLHRGQAHDAAPGGERTLSMTEAFGPRFKAWP
jgi:hypothetical protein